MKELFLTLLPYKVLFSHILFVLLVVVVVYRKGWGRKIFLLMGKYSLHLAFLASLSAVIGSLFYSEVMGYEPCTLCWWIRVFLYPLVVIFGLALWKKGLARSAFAFALPLTLAAFLISLYFSYYSLGGISLLPCTADEGACSRIFVQEFGYITIPMMSLTVAAYLLLLTWVNKLYGKENSNA